MDIALVSGQSDDWREAVDLAAASDLARRTRDWSDLTHERVVNYVLQQGLALDPSEASAIIHRWEVRGLLEPAFAIKAAAGGELKSSKEKSVTLDQARSDIQSAWPGLYQTDQYEHDPKTCLEPGDSITLECNGLWISASTSTSTTKPTSTLRAVNKSQEAASVFHIVSSDKPGLTSKQESEIVEYGDLVFMQTSAGATFQVVFYCPGRVGPVHRGEHLYILSVTSEDKIVTWSAKPNLINNNTAVSITSFHEGSGLDTAPSCFTVRSPVSTYSEDSIGPDATEEEEQSLKSRQTQVSEQNPHEDVAASKPSKTPSPANSANGVHVHEMKESDDVEDDFDTESRDTTSGVGYSPTSPASPTRTSRKSSTRKSRARKSDSSRSSSRSSSTRKSSRRRSSSRAQLGTPFDVVSLNVWLESSNRSTWKSVAKGVKSRKRTRAKAIPAALGETFNQQGILPDVLVISGASCTKSSPLLRAHIKRNLLMPFETPALGAGTTRSASGATWIASRYPIEKVAFFKFDKQRMTNRGAILVRVRKGQHCVNVITVNTMGGNSRAANIVREFELCSLRQWVQSLHLPQNEPLLFSGDLKLCHASQEDAYDRMLDILGTTDPAVQIKPKHLEAIRTCCQISDEYGKRISVKTASSKSSSGDANSTAMEVFSPQLQRSNSASPSLIDPEIRAILTVNPATNLLAKRLRKLPTLKDYILVSRNHGKPHKMQVTVLNEVALNQAYILSARAQANEISTHYPIALSMFVS